MLYPSHFPPNWDPVLWHCLDAPSVLPAQQHHKPGSHAGSLYAPPPQTLRCPCCTVWLQGTTTNGRYLLPFKTGAFLAGVPVLPTVIHYHTSRGGDGLSCSTAPRSLAAAAVVAAAAAASGLAASCGAAAGATAAAGVAAAGIAAVLGGSALAGVGGVSPCWESIEATRHLLLMMCQPFHTVTCYEVWAGG